ncbi:hypothetical protein COY27_04995 [Candidatus Woesearchaeota archaeon CG_4_10_14_0_2_um_filter_33_13]|nr:MAG: hypothetical protein COY27_04995 [Candidatus Woesearchaeota archaeon CG_4_10_14_0_2_um_filter_33_13]
MSKIIDDQFDEKLRTLEELMLRAGEIVDILNYDPEPGHLVFLSREGLMVEDFIRLSREIEDAYEQVFEYANHKSKNTAGNTNPWKERFASIEAGYSVVCQARTDLDGAREKATRLDCNEDYIILGEGHIGDDEEFARQSAILAKLVDEATEITRNPIAALERGSLGVLTDALRIDAISSNLTRYVRKGSFDGRYPTPIEIIGLNATAQREGQTLTDLANRLTNLSLVIYLKVESNPIDLEYQPD